MKVQVEITGPRWAERVPRKAMVALIILGALLIIGIPTAVLAAQVFNDVPPGAQFYDEINAIAGAGITTGCGSGNYCPDDTVTRKAMAAFMQRGFGRVHKEEFGYIDPIPTAYLTPVFTTTITSGVPPIALAGAKGFIQADVAINYQLTDATGAPCIYRAQLSNATNGTDFNSWFSTVYLTTAGERATIPLTGATWAGSGAQTIVLKMHRDSGTCAGSAKAWGVVTLSYYPFGGSGTNVLSPSASPARPRGPDGR